MEDGAVRIVRVGHKATNTRDAKDADVIYVE